MISINFKVIELTQTGFECARSKSPPSPNTGDGHYSFGQSQEQIHVINYTTLLTVSSHVAVSGQTVSQNVIFVYFETFLDNNNVVVQSMLTVSGINQGMSTSRNKEPNP